MKKNKKYIIGIDLGGTKTAVGVINLDGKILKKKKELTQKFAGKEGIIKQVLRLTEEVSCGYISDVFGMGIGAPSPQDKKRGILLPTPNLPNLEVPLIEPLVKRFKIPAYLENDANAAALGELLFGAGKRCKDIVYLTISTGIGGGIIIDGKLYTGANNNAGEIGHMVIDIDGPLCGCGNYGCLEALASGTAIARQAREYIIKHSPQTKILDYLKNLDEITSEIVFRAAKEKDEAARIILDKALNYLGIGIANVCNIFNPEKVILGGGVTQIGAPLFEKVRRVVHLRCFKEISKLVEIVPAKLGEDVGIVGAGAVVLMRNKQQ